MALTKLADIIEPSVFLRYMFLETRVRSAAFTSGILEDDPEMQDFLRGGGKTVDVPFWNDLGDGSDPNIGSDDETSSASTAKITAAEDIAIRHNRNKGWSTARMSRLIAGDDPMQRIVEHTGGWWARSFNLHLINTIKGVIADNAANDGGDMRNVIGLDAAGTPGQDELISAEAIIDTAQTMGDQSQELSLLIMHSLPHSRLKKLNLIDTVHDSDGKVMFETYLGYPIIVDDNTPAVAGSNQTNYSTYLVGRGSFAFAEVPLPENEAVEFDRYPAKGDGQGVDELWTRRQYLLHPRGVKWTSSSMAGTSPTNAELAAAANWDRVYPERKQVAIAVLVTHG